MELQNLPPLAKITSHSTLEIPCQGESLNYEPFFEIKQTCEGDHLGHSVIISPDTATCELCHQDIFDHNNFRKAYPFTNCTNCGPRYTITASIPYDRTFTSMACFPLCPECKAEYDNPLDRRFHAQPNACPKCGPTLWLNSAKDINLEHDFENLPANTLYHKEALVKAIKLINSGEIIAIKSLGGFQLCCDAGNVKAVEKLRKRKNRPHKAFAVMVADIETAREIAQISSHSEELLMSPEAPIVLCPRKSVSLPENIAPDTNRLGIMLAYTPLHKILLNPVCLSEDIKFSKVLIMTSANSGGEPICIKNRQALESLPEIADYFLFHNRDILVRVDDSVCLALGTAKQPSLPNKMFFRRARGYVPSPIALPKSINYAENDSVLGVGAFLKNTFTLTKKNQAFVSQHIGDLDNLAVIDFYEETFDHLLKLLEVKPKAIVCDLHPDFPSTKFAKDFAKNNIPIFSLPHHYAHAYAVLAEYKDYDLSPCLALILDGTGLGEDQEIWGGELLYLDPKNDLHFRLGRIKPIILPGGEKAIYEPWRVAQALYEKCISLNYLSEEDKKSLPYPWLENEDIAKISEMLTAMIDKNIQCIQTSSCGRLFDAISALLGLCYFTSYEGQAAIKLESAQFSESSKGQKKSDYSCKIIENIEIKRCREEFLNNYGNGLNKTNCIGDVTSPIWELDSHDLFAHFVKELIQNKSIAELSIAFHQILADGLINVIKKAAEFSNISQIILGGGVMNNETLFLKFCHGLNKFQLFTPQNIPSSDGSII